MILKVKIHDDYSRFVYINTETIAFFEESSPMHYYNSYSPSKIIRTHFSDGSSLELDMDLKVFLALLNGGNEKVAKILYEQKDS